MKSIFVKSIRAVIYNSKFILLFWAFNALMALVLSVPIFYILTDNLSRSLINDKLMSGFDYTWYIQFQNLYKLHIEQMPLSIAFVVGIYTLVQTFFLGGLISIFNLPQKNLYVDFFYGGVKYFYRFTKVLLVTLIFYTFVFLIIDWLGNLISTIFADSENELFEFVLRLLTYLLLIFFIGIITIISDYSKVSLAINDKKEAIKGIFTAIKFIKNNFNIAFIFFLIVAILGATGAVLYNFIEKEIPRTPGYFLILSFVLQQMLIIFRLYIRMLFASTEVSLYKDLSAEQLHVELKGEFN
ncbi:hypothetical protein ABRY23_01560 [Melioribacteraceae bacterium 4301-Me]|uniref:hypothetical protein n=1 Tax=Pyranulibacter aquaticus TaxID=3163344 RepID=UPI003597FB7F